jgi:hypothetical protein
MKDYCDDITFSVCVFEKDKNPAWKKILTKFRKELKESYERAYAFSVYQELPQPPKEIEPFFLSEKLNQKLRSIL